MSSCYSCLVMDTLRLRIMLVVALIAVLLGAGIVPVALADVPQTLASARSFPKANVVRRDITAESTSTSVDDQADWGGVEQLDVPQTQSQAERDEAARQAAQEEQEQARLEQEQQAAASRSAQRDAVQQSQSFTETPPDGQSVAALLAYADQFVGKVPYRWGGSTTAGWDCSGFVQYVYASMGITLPHSSSGQATVGTAVASLDQAQPGDIVANAEHAAIYVGNGMVVNAQMGGTMYSPVSWVFHGSYAIRRVL